MATASSPWMPAAGRHNVSIGSSLSRALKARKGQPPTQRSKALPERDFYALRYNHKPASIDPSKSGTLEVNPGREVTTVRVERPTVNSNEVIVFKGEEKPAKEWECVLIYDEATQTFTLEKLDSLVNLNFDTKAPPRTRQTVSPPSGASSSSAVQTPQRSPMRTAADELEAQLEVSSAGGLGTYTDTDADGEPDPSFSLAQEEEEEEEAAPPIHRSHQAPPRRSSSSAAHQKTAAPPAPPPPPPAPLPQATITVQQAKTRPTPSKKSAPAAPPPPATTPQSAKAARVSGTAAKASKASKAAKAAKATTATPVPVSAPAPAPSSKPRPRPIPPAPRASTPAMPGSAKRAAVEHRDVEDFEIRGPIAPLTTTTTATPSATRRTSTTGAQGVGSSSFSLALPTATAGPDPLAHQGMYNGAAAASGGGGGESDDEWDEILAQPDRLPPSSSSSSQQQQQQQQMLTITIEDDADDGLDFLERELLGEDEPVGDGDGDGDGDEEEEMEEEMMGLESRVGAGAASAGPMSMNQFVGGNAGVEDDDDDFSSSEESEED